MGVFCAIAVRNEERYLPGFLKHMRGHVDGIVALDDSSGDTTRGILEREPAIVSILSEDNKAAAHANETRNRYRLVKEARRLGADWLLCGDADERFETRFLKQLRRLVDMPHRSTPQIRCLRLVNLWNSANHYRSDGLCGPRWSPRLFRIPEHFTARQQAMHRPWHPPEMDGLPSAHANAFIYHLRMIHRADRMARFVKFKTLDPHDHDQSLGYSHLIQERGRRLKRIMPWRQYEHDNSIAVLTADLEAPAAYNPCHSNEFDATHYLAHNPDVDRAVARGAFASAWDHFERTGKFERRVWRRKPFLSIDLPRIRRT
jgi:hypothetical protein